MVVKKSNAELINRLHLCTITNLWPKMSPIWSNIGWITYDIKLKIITWQVNDLAKDPKNNIYMDKLKQFMNATVDAQINLKFLFGWFLDIGCSSLVSVTSCPHDHLRVTLSNWNRLYYLAFRDDFSLNTFQKVK